MAEIYTGYKTVRCDDENLSNFYSDKSKETNWFNLLENQYLVVVDGDGNPLEQYKWQDGKHKKVANKTLESGMLGKIKPLNVEQKLAIDMLLDTSITVKVLVGSMGSGKDLLMTAAAFYLMNEGNANRIVWCRNNIEVRDTNSIGALPGSLYEKIGWTASTLIDHLGGEDALRIQMDSAKVEVQFLGHIRGRDIRDSIILCSEAENLSRDHMKLLLGRVAAGSSLWVNGDSNQRDSKVFELNNGLEAAIDRLKGNRLFGYVYMPHSVRSETAKLADLLD
jgi:PhoH-like ATPase